MRLWKGGEKMALLGNMAAYAADSVSAAYKSLNSAVNNVGSGQRINSAKDDAAGLAVRELMRADIATARQGSRNVSDGISMLQTADGAASAISGNLTRMQQLVTQASTGTLSTDQKNIIQQEFNQLAEANAQIASSTTFNDISLFQNGSVEIELGDGNMISVSTEAMAAVSADVVNDPAGAAAAVETAITQVNTMRGNLGASSNRLESAGSVLDIKAENILASESRISDVDMAKEVANMTAKKIAVESAIAAQVHARTVSQVVGILLG